MALVWGEQVRRFLPDGPFTSKFHEFCVMVCICGIPRSYTVLPQPLKFGFSALYFWHFGLLSLRRCEAVTGRASDGAYRCMHFSTQGSLTARSCKPRSSAPSPMPNHTVGFCLRLLRLVGLGTDKESPESFRPAGFSHREALEAEGDVLLARPTVQGSGCMPGTPMTTCHLQSDQVPQSSQHQRTLFSDGACSPCQCERAQNSAEREWFLARNANSAPLSNRHAHRRRIGARAVGFQHRVPYAS